MRAKRDCPLYKKGRIDSIRSECRVNAVLNPSVRSAIRAKWDYINNHYLLNTPRLIAGVHLTDNLIYISVLDTFRFSCNTFTPSRHRDKINIHSHGKKANHMPT